MQLAAYSEGVEQLPKRVQEAAVEVESYDLNGITFDVRNCYCQGHLLNGLELKPLEARGVQTQHVQLSYPGILFHCGTNIMEYNPLNRSYKLLMKVQRLLLMSMYEDQLYGRNFLIVLSRSTQRKQHHIEVYDHHLRQVIWTEVFSLNGWEPIRLFLYYSNRKYFVVLLKKEYECKLLIGHHDGGIYEQALPFMVGTAHMDNSTGCCLVTDEERVMSLVMMPDGPLFELRSICECNQPVELATYGERTLVFAGRTWLQLYSMKSKSFSGEYTLDQLLGPYSKIGSENQVSASRKSQRGLSSTPAISCVEARLNTLLVGFSVASVVLQFSLDDPPTLNRTIKLQSVSFLRISRIMLEADGAGALLISTHNQNNETSSANDLHLGEPTPVSSQSRKTINLVTQLAMNIMNSQYALQPLRWEPQEYINILTSPWSNEQFLHVNNRITGKGWQQPLQQSFSSDLHPTGLLLAIGFRDCFKIYAVTNSGLSATNLGDIVRECRSLSYSSQGNHLAAMSFNNVHIYNSYTCERLHVLQHAQSSVMKKLKYVRNQLHCLSRSNKFYSYSMNNAYGLCMQFAPREFLPARQKDINFDAVEYDPELDVFVATRANEVRFFINRGNDELLCHRFPGRITCIEICRQLKCMFLGTDNGEIHCFPWPNNPRRIELEYPKITLHQSAVALIKVSNDLSSITSVSAKGSLYRCSVKVVDKLREVHFIELAFENKATLAVNGLLSYGGLVLHSRSQQILVEETVKNLEESILNSNFMRPEEQEKAKNGFITSIQTERETLTISNKRKLEQITNQQIDLRTAIVHLRKEQDTSQKEYLWASKNQLDVYNTQLEEVLKRRALLERDFSERKIQYNKELEELVCSNRQELERMANKNQENVEILDSAAASEQYYYCTLKREMEIDVQENQFEQINVNRNFLNSYETEIERLYHKNSVLTSSNNRLGKDIKLLEMRAAQLSDSIRSMQHELENKQKPEKAQQGFKTQPSLCEEESMMKIESEYIRSAKLIARQVADLSGLTEIHEKKEAQTHALEKRLEEINAKETQVMGWILAEKKAAITCGKQKELLIGHLQQMKALLSKLRLNRVDSKNVLKTEKEKALKLIDSRVKARQNPAQNNVRGQESERTLTELPPSKLNTVRARHQKTLPDGTGGGRHPGLQTRILKLVRSRKRAQHTAEWEEAAYKKSVQRSYRQNEDLVEYLNTLTFENRNLKDSLAWCSSNRQKKRDVLIPSLKPIDKTNRVVRCNYKTPFQRYHQESPPSSYRFATEPNATTR